MLDFPGRRRSHVEPTPRGGGIGVLAGALLPLLASLWWLGMSSGLMMMAYVVAAVAVAAIGWLDDVRGVSPLPRLVVHALAAALFVVVLQRVSGYPIGLAGSVLDRKSTRLNSSH